MTEPPTVPHIDSRANVMIQSENNLTKMSSRQPRQWLFIGGNYFSIETKQLSNSRLFVEGENELVTAEKLLAVLLWNVFGECLCSQESVPNLGSDRDPVDLIVDMLTTEDCEKELQYVRMVLANPNLPELERNEVLHSLFARNNIITNMLICLNLKRHSKKGDMVKSMFLTLFESFSTCSGLNMTNVMRMGKLSTKGTMADDYLIFRSAIWRRNESFILELKDSHQKLWECTKYHLCFNSNVEVTYLETSDESADYPALPKNFIGADDVSVREENGIHMIKGVDGSESWLAKGLKSLLLLDFTRNAEGLTTTDLIIFPIGQGFIVSAMKMNVDDYFKPEFIVKMNLDLCVTVENGTSQFGRFSNHRPTSVTRQLLDNCLTKIPSQSNVMYFQQ